MSRDWQERRALAQTWPASGKRAETRIKEERYKGKATNGAEYIVDPSTSRPFMC